MKLLWCWRCKMDIPMLDEAEYEQVHALIIEGMQDIKEYRRVHNVPLEAVDSAQIFRPACEAYERLTGVRETNVNAIGHHRVSMYGPPCKNCGKVLRTAVAIKCFECGHQRP